MRLKKIQKFKSLIQNYTDKKIKMSTSNNGGKYTSKEFDTFCKEAWIKRALMVPYNPQENGVIETKNISIIEIA
jgi:transposase InsO family protein